MQKIFMLALLMLCAAEDFKKKEVTITYIMLFGIGGLVLHMFSPNCSIYSMLFGILLGVAVAAVSFLSRGNIGMGDGVLLMVTGIYLGGFENLRLFLTGLLLTAVWALMLILVKRKNKKEQIAFVPFLLAAYVIMLVG